MKRATVDTNIFISALFWKGVPDRVLDVFRQQQAILLLSDDILNELELKLSSAKFAIRISNIGASPTQLVEQFRNLAEPVEPVTVPEGAVRDPKDRMILGCAVGGNADLIISGDKDLTELKSYQDILVVTPAEFLTIMNSPEETSLDTPS